MKVVFRKKDLRLNEDLLSNDKDNNNKPALAVSNSEGDNDVSTLRADVEKTNQYNSNHNPLEIDTQSYTNKKLPTGNNASGQEMSFKNTPQAASQIQQMINTTPAQSLPTKIKLQNGLKRSGKLVEIATFKKKDLDKFLNEL